MRSDESGTEQAAQPVEPQEAQRNLPLLLGHLAEKFGDGTVTAAGAYVGKKAMEKVFGGQDQGSAKPESPREQPPSQAE